MNAYVVLYRDASLKPADPPLAWTCQADDDDHAEEQLLNAEPSAEVVWVWLGGDVQDAYDDYWGGRS